MKRNRKRLRDEDCSSSAKRQVPDVPNSYVPQVVITSSVNPTTTSYTFAP